MMGRPKQQVHPRGRRSLRPAPSLLPALLGAVTACGAAERAGDAPATTVRDSAGITIVQNAAIPRLEEAGWRIADSPAVVIGRADGKPGDMLHRVSGAVRLRDGRIVVANGGSGELRFYDPRGRYLSAAGRRGGGPGEFESLSAIHAHGDSVLVNDMSQNRVSVFDADGRFVRSFRLEVKEGYYGPLFLGVLGDGRIVVRTIAAPDGGARTTALTRSPNILWIHDASGAVLDSITTVPGWQAFDFVDSDGYRLSNMPIPFGPNGVMGVRDGRLVVADTERPEYRAYDAAGALERIVRWTPAPPLRVTEEETAQIKAGAIERAPPTFRARLQRAYDAMPVPRSKTPFNSVYLDAEGCVWATTWPDPESGRQTAAVFAADGRALGSLELPRRLSIHEIGADYLLAGAIDDLGVESVHLYPLTRADGC